MPLYVAQRNDPLPSPPPIGHLFDILATKFDRFVCLQTFRCGYPPLCLEEWEAMAAAAKVVCIRGRYTTYLDRDSASLFYQDEVSLVRFASH